MTTATRSTLNGPRLWLEAIRTVPRVDPASVDPVSRWLILGRVSVVVMSAISAVIGGLLAARDDVFDLPLLILVALGLILAHTGSNLVNDFWDYRHGIDSPDSPRVNYGPHPFGEGSSLREFAAGDHLRARRRRRYRHLPRRRRGHGRARLRAHGGGPASPLLRRPLPAEVHRPRRDRCLHHLGPADDRRHVLRDGGRAARLGAPGLRPLRPRRHDRPLRQAPRQARLRHRKGHPHDAHRPRRIARATRHDRALSR